MGQSVEVLCALPENPDDEDVAVDNDEDRKYKEDSQLVPGEDYALSTSGDVVIRTRHHDDVVLIVVEQALRRLLMNTRKHVQCIIQRILYAYILLNNINVNSVYISAI